MTISNPGTTGVDVSYCKTILIIVELFGYWQGRFVKIITRRCLRRQGKVAFKAVALTVVEVIQLLDIGAGLGGIGLFDRR